MNRKPLFTLTILLALGITLLAVWKSRHASPKVTPGRVRPPMTAEISQSSHDPPLAAHVVSVASNQSVPRTSTPEKSQSRRDGESQIHKRIEDAPLWAIGYGKEFWRRPIQGPVSKVKGTAPRSIDLSDMIERVSHAFHVSAENGKPEVQSSTYSAVFDERGLRFSTLAGEESPQDKIIEAGFRTAAIERGTAILYEAQENHVSSVLGNTAQVLLNSGFGIVEHYETRREGVAVTWVFAERPPEQGPLAVTAEVEGLTYLTETASGHHYADETGTARMRVGKAVLVDTSGHRWELPVVAMGNRLQINVSAGLLAEATFPAAIDPMISPEFDVDRPVVKPAWGSQISPAVASNGTNYLVVWNNHPGTSSEAIVGARVSMSGEVLDLSGFTIADEPKSQLSPAVAALGNNYLVVWQYDEGTPTARDIHGTRVSGDGVVLSGLLLIARVEGLQEDPAVAANGNGYLVVWRDYRAFNGYNIYGRRVSAEGMVLNEIAINTQAADQGAPAVASDGTNYLVAWQDTRPFGYGTNIFFARLTDLGAVYETIGVALTDQPFGLSEAPAVAFNGNYLIAWHAIAGMPAGLDILGDRVAVDGTILDSPVIRINSAPGGQTLPSVASSSNGFLVVWEDSRNASTTGFDIYGTQVTTDGQVLDTNGLPVSAASVHQRAPAIAFNGNYLVVWEDSRNLDTGIDIYGTLLSAAGVVTNLNGYAISTGVNFEYTPAAAFNGTNYLVVWQDERHAIGIVSQADVYGGRIGTDGSMLDPAGIHICSNGQLQLAPVVASQNGSFLVVWSDYREFDNSGVIECYGTPVTGAGTVGNTNGLPIERFSYCQEIAIGAHPNGYLVVWQAPAGSFYKMDVQGKRVTPTGTVLDESAIRIGAAQEDQVSPALACNGTNFLVVWRDNRNIDVTREDIYGARVTWDGIVLDLTGIPISLAIKEQLNPAVAAQGGNYLVVWQDNREAIGFPPGSDIYGTVVTDAGPVLHTNGFAINRGLSAQWYPAIAASENRFLVVWDDRRNFSPACGLDLYGARVNPDGTILDPDGLAINTNNNFFHYDGIPLLPSIAYGHGGTFLVVHQGFRDGQIRTAANFVSLADLPTRILSITPASGGMTLTWEAVTGNVYRVQFTAHLNSPNWMDLNGEVIATTSTASKTDDTLNANSQRFYRVVQVP